MSLLGLLLLFGTLLFAESNPVTMDCHNPNFVTLDYPDPIQTIDYLKIGTPLQLVLWLVSTWVLSTPSLWFVSLLITSAVLVVVATVCLGSETLQKRLKQGVGQNHHKS